jgi:hypothetical protein
MGLGAAFGIVMFCLIFIVVQLPWWLPFVDKTMAR